MSTRLRSIRLPHILVLLPAIAFSLAQEAPVTMPEDSVGPDPVVAFPLMWRFHPEDNPAFAAPGFDDSAWTLADTRLQQGETPVDWAGRGWFRLRFTASDAWLNQALAWTLIGRGAAEVYLDGDRLMSGGTLGDPTGPVQPFLQRIPEIVVLPAAGPHLLAVRYANPDWRRYHRFGDWAGFAITSQFANQAVPVLARSMASDSALGMFFVGVALAFGILHLALFAFHPASKENLYFALYIEIVGLVTYALLQRDITTDPVFRYLYLIRIQGAGGVLALLMGLVFLYQVFYSRMPRRLIWIAPLTIAYSALLWIAPAWGNLFPYFALAVSVEMIRVVATAILRRQSGAWLVGVGMAGLALSFGFLMLAELGWAPLNQATRLIPYYGALFLTFCMSLYLARNFARTQRQLREQLQRVKRLSKKTLEQERAAHRQQIQQQQREAEYARKTQELEEARRLQLSLLPERLPDHPWLQLAAHMQTATEVGGDYYDFQLHGTDRLTLLVGDATGHGMKAGMMVTATKSLFNSMAEDEKLTAFLKRASAALKRMNLRQLYMSLIVARFVDGTVTLAGAGMPSVLVARADSGNHEEIAFRSPPLGSFPAFPYQVSTVHLDPGDTLLLMTDGFSELFDSNGEMLGYERASEIFQLLCRHSPQEVLDGFRAAAKSWSAGKPIDDDMTFVVVRVSPPPHP